MTWANRAVLITGAAGFASFFTLFAVVPALANTAIGSIGAGVATGSLLTATVVTQLAVPALMRRFAPWLLMAAALLLLGLPSLVYAFDVSVPVLLGATVLRGAGFGLLTIVSTSLAAHYAPAGKQGAALGWLGLVTALAGVISPGLGVWLLDNVSAAIPAAGAFIIPVLALAGLGPIRRASPQPLTPPRQPAADRHTDGPGVFDAPLLIPLIVYLPGAMTYGVVYTFLPEFSAVAAFALVTFGAGYAIGRTYGGRWADRWGTRRILVPATVISSVTVVSLAWTSVAWLTILAAFVLGCSIGTSATASLAGMMQRVDPAGYGRASAAWNINFDVGIALGGALIGVVVALLGFTGAVMVCAIMLGIVAVIGFFGLRPQIELRT